MSSTMVCRDPSCGHCLDSVAGTEVRCPRCSGEMIPLLSETPAAATLDLPLDSDAKATLDPPPQFADTADRPDQTPTPRDPNLPERIGRFRIQRLLGEGTFGVVYLARDPQLDREVALKVAKPGTLDSPQRLHRFRREAKAVANLRHPNIVPLFDAGEELGKHYLATAFIRGHTLETLIAETKDQGLPISQAIHLTRKLAEALDYAHTQGIVHRDVKPANVLVDEHGEPHLMDFGLAAMHVEGEERFTQEKVQMGTPAYMSPEQWRGDQSKVTAASDQYSLGCLFSECLTGRPPFEGNTPQLMALHLKEEPPRLRSRRRELSLDVETIGRKCLAKEPRDRYVSCREAARDLRAVQEERPISARRVGVVERSVRWVRKNPAWATMLSLFFVTLLSGLGVSLYYAERAGREAETAKEALKDAQAQQTRRALAQVETLLTADPRGVASVLKSLEEERDDVLERLKEVWQNPSRDRDRLRAGLALLPVETDTVRTVLIDGMLSVKDPAELIAIRDALIPFMKSRSAPLWQKLEESPDRRLQLLSALAAFDPQNPKWDAVGDSILQPWLSDNPLYLGDWTDALRPVRLSLIPPVQKVFRGEILPEFKYVAANLLADYAADRPEVLADLITTADDRQFATLFPVLEKHKSKALELLRPEVAKVPPPDDLPEDESIAKWKPDWSPEEHEAYARKRSGASLALLRLGDADSVWPVLKSSPYPESRTRLSLRVASTNVDAKTLIDRLKVETDVGVRRALILSLGEYREEQIPPESRREVTELLLRWYQEDPDSGIHGAIDWLLRPDKEGLQDRPLKWGQREKLAEIDRAAAESTRRTQLARIAALFSGAGQPLAGSRLLPPNPPVKSGHWWVNSQGQTFAVVESREPWAMGSPQSERERRSDETLHWRQIDRKFGMMTKAVTVAEFQRFLKANPKIRWIYQAALKQHAPEADCPMVIVSWWEAAQYCRWLSEQEGIPEWEMVYPSIEEIERGKRQEKPLVLASNHLSRKGYRLPTEAEWEYLARGGSRTSCYFGSGLDLLPRHAWYLENGKNRSWPVGQKRPSEWGLFDLSGNSFTWCQEAGFRYKAGTVKRPVGDQEEDGSLDIKQGITEKLARSLRGGAVGYHSINVRSSYRIADLPTNHGLVDGLRPCRTFD